MKPSFIISVFLLMFFAQADAQISVWFSPLGTHSSFKSAPTGPFLQSKVGFYPRDGISYRYRQANVIDFSLMSRRGLYAVAFGSHGSTRITEVANDMRIGYFRDVSHSNSVSLLLGLQGRYSERSYESSITTERRPMYGGSLLARYEAKIYRRLWLRYQFAMSVLRLPKWKSTKRLFTLFDQVAIIYRW